MPLNWRFWKRPETRSVTWADAVSQLRHIQAGTSFISDQYLGSREIAAGMVSRAFMTAEVQSTRLIVNALNPPVLARMGRDLISAGESVWYVSVRGSLQLVKPYSYTLYGNDDLPENWEYDLYCSTPTGGTISRRVQAADTIHIKYDYDASDHYGKGPLQHARDLASGAMRNEQNLSKELSSPVGTVLPGPIGDLEDEDFADLKRIIGNLSGDITLVEAMDSGFGSGVRHDRRGRGPGWDPKRLGPDPPAILGKLLESYSALIALCAGIPAELVKSDASSTAKREALRQFLHCTLRPLGKLAEWELSRKLDAPVRLDFSSLSASDVQGRSRAYAAFRKAGMPDADARRYSGLE